MDVPLAFSFLTPQVGSASQAVGLSKAGQRGLDEGHVRDAAEPQRQQELGRRFSATWASTGHGLQLVSPAPSRHGAVIPAPVAEPMQRDSSLGRPQVKRTGSRGLRRTTAAERGQVGCSREKGCSRGRAQPAGHCAPGAAETPAESLEVSSENGETWKIGIMRASWMAWGC